MTRAQIKNFQDGEYFARDCLDGDGQSADRIWVDVKVTIDGSNIIADLTKSSDQSSGGMNCSYSAASSAVQYAIKAIADPENPPNAGSYKPINVITRPGTLVDAKFPASIVGFGEVCYRVFDVTMAAISTAIGDKAIASGSGSTGTVVIAGPRHRSSGDRYFTTLELSSGAYGARANCDGINAIRYGPGNAGHIPIEADEIENPIFFEKYEIVPDTGGAGRFRGGNGFVRNFRIEADSAQICICADRHETPPPGLFGGYAGSTAHYLLESGNKKKRHQVLPSKTPYIDLKKNTLVSLQSAGGGGFGNPIQRDHAMIAEDLRDGYITKAAAVEVYKYPYVSDNEDKNEKKRIFLFVF